MIHLHPIAADEGIKTGLLAIFVEIEIFSALTAKIWFKA
jgi:hypothetical protein